MTTPDTPRHILNWHELDRAVWDRCLESALQHEADRRWTNAAHGRSMGLLFFNASLRTRTSMELAGRELGAHMTTLNMTQGLWGMAWEQGVPMAGTAAEHITEAMGVLSQYYAALGVRLFANFETYAPDRQDARMRQLMAAASVPVVNLESAFYHPCQGLADAATIARQFQGDVAGRQFVLTWAYHPKALPMAVPNSALLMAARLGMNVTVARPEGYELDEAVMTQARCYAEAQGTHLKEVDDPDAAYVGADVIYAKAWGGSLAYTDPERERSLRGEHSGWRVTQARMDRTRQGVFMHCLPVRRGVVVDDAVLDGPQTVHLQQAGFRLHAQKAMLEYVWDL